MNEDIIDIDQLKPTEFHLTKGLYGDRDGIYGAWIGYHNEKGYGFCCEYCKGSLGLTGEVKPDYITIYRQTRVEAKLGLKGRKLKDFDEEKMRPLMEKASSAILQAGYNVTARRFKNQNKKAQEESTKMASYIKKIKEYFKQP